MRSLPPTAQVAGQQGAFLAARFNGETREPFKYFHKGSMAYVGQEKAAAQAKKRRDEMLKAVAVVPLSLFSPSPCNLLRVT